MNFSQIVVAFLLGLCVACQAQAPTERAPIFVDGSFESVMQSVSHDSLARALYDDLVQKTKPFAGLTDGSNTKKKALKQARDITQQAMQHAFLFRVTDNPVNLTEAVAYLTAACELPDWNPDHFLDLAEITFGVSVASNWLDGSLQPAQRTMIQQAIEQKAFNVYLDLAAKPGGRFWTRGENNWTIVCNGALYVASVLNPGYAKSEGVQRESYANLKKGLELYAPDGLWFEGPMYWSYATNYAVFAMEAERWSTGKKSPLVADPGIDRTLPTFFSLVGPSGKTFNYGDANTENIGVTPAVLKLATYFDQEKESDAYLNLLRKRVLDKGKAYDHRFALFNLLWYPSSVMGSEQPDEATMKLIRGKFDVVVVNSQPGSERNLYMAIKGGKAEDSHQHRDAGSFVLDFGDQRFFSDLGKEEYSLKTKDGRSIDKKSVYRVSSKAHNVLRVNDQEQSEVATAKAIIYSVNGSEAARFDLSSVYKGQCGSVIRNVSVLDGSIVLEDELTGCNGSVVWQGMTQAKVTVDGRKVILRRKDKKIRLQVVEPQNAVVEIIKPEVGSPAETPVAGYDQILVKCADGTQKIKIRFFPML